jgi:polysaccharide biosynthesis protein PslG
MVVLPVLFNPPAWHSSRPASGGARGTYPPADPGSMARFAAAAVVRYGPGGSLWHENPGVRPRPVRSWQVWNEPTLPAYWGGRPNARAYVKLLKAVNGAIKRFDRRGEVVTAGLPPSKLRGSVPVLRYIRQLYRAGGKRYFDTLAVNSYARNAKELGRLLEGVRGAMNRGGDRRARIWITELGWCDNGPAHRFCVGSANQAKLTRTSIALIRRNRKRLKLRGFVYYTWRDGAPYGPDYKDQWGLHTGLVGLDGRPKPALLDFIRALSGLR